MPGVVDRRQQRVRPVIIPVIREQYPPFRLAIVPERPVVHVSVESEIRERGEPKIQIGQDRNESLRVEREAEIGQVPLDVDVGKESDHLMNPWPAETPAGSTILESLEIDCGW